MKQCFLVLCLILTLGLLPSGARAYGKEVHFNLTYVLCRLSGLPLEDALWVALADQSMDDNGCTSAFGNGSASDTANALYWLSHRDRSYLNGAYFHDFNDVSKKPGTDQAPWVDGIGRTIKYMDNGQLARANIHNRLLVLWMRIPIPSEDNRSRITADIALGQYLHAEQDYFSHRQYNAVYLVPRDSDTGVFPANSFLPYGPTAGHANDGDRHSADYVILRPALACLMAQDSYRHIRRYEQSANPKSLPPELVPTQSLNLLVHALAQTYMVRLPPPLKKLPANYDTVLSAIKQIEITPPTEQSSINSSLQAALAALPASALWQKHLPSYDAKYTLSYDVPSLPLIAARQRLKDMIAAQNLTELLPGPVSLVGEWSTNWGPLELKPDYTGSWTQGGRIGQIKDGAFDPSTNKLVFHYYQPWNGANGTATLTLSQDENTLTGEYRQDRGFADAGSWTMTRDPGHAERRATTLDSVLGKWEVPGKLAKLSPPGYFDLKPGPTGSWHLKIGKETVVTPMQSISYDAKERTLKFDSLLPKRQAAGRVVLNLSDDESILGGFYNEAHDPYTGKAITSLSDASYSPQFMTIFARPFSEVLTKGFLEETTPKEVVSPASTSPL